ncbi:ABC transporter permease subunit [Alteromonas sediminis]|uniref:ABC transporter permease subunit n=1 Tax=Alteromonas sediminis TaxID=2259342 RepID=A0A3N5ZAI4_9ALTE|nr:ABC transporter permease subunit [Alteromonas sediminis]RPJ68134.1 ABC transporter permease subunit [Alteromonas sediminis]
MTALSQQYDQRMRKDTRIRRLVTLFGGGILVLLLVIVWHLVSQTAPLFISPSFEKAQTFDFPDRIVLSVGDILEDGLLVQQASPCGIETAQVSEQNKVVDRILKPCTHSLSIREERDQRWLFDISANGQVRIQGIDGDNATYAFALPETDWQQRLETDYAISLPHIAIRVTTASQHLIFWVDTRRLTDIHKDEYPASDAVVLLPGQQKVVTFQGRKIALTERGRESRQTYQHDYPINWIGRIENSRSLYVSDRSGKVERWVVVNKSGRFEYVKTYSLFLEDNEQPLTVQAHANTNAGFVLTDMGRLILFNRVSGELLDIIQLVDIPISWSWYGNRLYLVYPGKVDVWTINNLAGVNTPTSLFVPQWYEGYLGPEHVYQTSSGRDFNEAKYALIPLLMGSLKAALAALVVAIPVSIGAAIYTGFFTTRRWRKSIKPAIEMLEAVPSVVIGFIAAVALAPVADKLLTSLLLFIVTLPLLLFVVALFQHRIAVKMPTRLRFGADIAAITLCTLVWAGLSLYVADSVMPIEIFSGSSKTTLIVAIALGLAISSTIYTLAEDAIESVPSGLKNASFALGATRLQTLRNIVLRVAMPGLIAAVMLGFGRAFGETMIVLMVTGNTPIPSWDLFESLRALTANIAIELPEADTGGALYSVLFFTALTLFIFTFIVNTVAEWLRYGMREKVKYD